MRLLLLLMLQEYTAVDGWIGCILTVSNILFSISLIYFSISGMIYRKCFRNGCLYPIVTRFYYPNKCPHLIFITDTSKNGEMRLFSEQFCIVITLSRTCRVYVCHQVMYSQWPTHCICRCLYYSLCQAVRGAFYLDLRALLTSLHPHPLPIKQNLLILRLIKDFWN